MAIKHYNPVTPGQRKKSTLVNEELTKTAPEKSLLKTVKKHAGRNNSGKITVRHQGGGEKRKYRIIDFRRNKYDIVGTVATIEYDPNRSANIALINYSDGEKRYIIAPKGLKVGMKVISGEKTDVKVIESHEINTYDVLNYDNLVITEEAVKMLEEVLK